MTASNQFGKHRRFPLYIDDQNLGWCLVKEKLMFEKKKNIALMEVLSSYIGECPKQ